MRHALYFWGGDWPIRLGFHVDSLFEIVDVGGTLTVYPGTVIGSYSFISIIISFEITVSFQGFCPKEETHTFSFSLSLLNATITNLVESVRVSGGKNGQCSRLQASHYLREHRVDRKVVATDNFTSTGKTSDS